MSPILHQNQEDFTVTPAWRWFAMGVIVGAWILACLGWAIS